MADPISLEDAADRIVAVLRYECGLVHPDAGNEVRAWIVAGSPGVEYRFGGSLGFGGKLWMKPGELRVSCYKEDRTSERDATIARANILLALICDALTTYESCFAVAVNEHPLSVLDARRKSHDAVIASTGRARLSGVTWTTFPLGEWREALRWLGIEIDESRVKPPGDVEVLALAHPEGLLVAATVMVDPRIDP